MLDEPYRWVEAIRNRREYIEDQLQTASPVVGATYDGGIVLMTTSPGPRKLFEVYNQVAFAAIGHPADIEKLRKAVIDIAHVEAFNLSANDVQLQRLVNSGIGPLMKTAFDEIFRSPFIARVLVAELDPSSNERFYTIDADGSFSGRADGALIAGSAQAAEAIAAIQRRQRQQSADLPPLNEALKQLLEAWATGRLQDARDEVVERAFSDEEIATCIRDTVGEQTLEISMLDRSLPTKTKFRRATAEELESAVSDYR